jgi:hypothetical protein
MKVTEWTMGLEHDRLKRLIHAPAVLALKAGSWAESKLWAKAQLHYSPIFIVAPPRSGTTLLYQLMTGHLSTSYFTNLAMRFHVQKSPVTPILGAKLAKLLKPKPTNESFKSYYGATKGWDGPHEGHWVWNQYFPEEKHHIPADYLSAKDRQGLYRSVAGTERVFDRPFVSKHIRNCVRIQALSQVFPTALYIYCTRHPLDTAQSIYIARTRDFPFVEGEIEDPVKWWFSVKPKEYDAIKGKSLIEQVCEQVYFIDQSIIQDLNLMGQDRFLIVDYKDLCEAPQREMDHVVEFMNAHNAPTQILEPIPESFPYSTGCKIDRNQYDALADYLSQLYGRPMTRGDN